MSPLFRIAALATSHGVRGRRRHGLVPNSAGVPRVDRGQASESVGANRAVRGAPEGTVVVSPMRSRAASTVADGRRPIRIRESGVGMTSPHPDPGLRAVAGHITGDEFSGEDGQGPGTVTDEELIRRVAHGDTSAFEAIYARHARTVFGMVLRVLRDPAQSEEVAQEVLVEVWAYGGAVRSRPGQPACLGGHHGPAPGDRSGAGRRVGRRSRGACGGRRAHPRVRPGQRDGRGHPGARTRAALPGLADPHPAPVGGPGLLRRVHLPRGGGAARAAAGHGEDPAPGTG